MFKLEYLINGKMSQSWHFPNKPLCNWKKAQLKKAGTHTKGKFNINEIKN